MARAVILAGGLGSRLRPYTTVIPKPLMPLGEHPILEILLLQLARQGFERVDLCIGYLGHLIRAYFGDGSAQGIAIEYHEEAEPLGTMGALANIGDVQPDEALLMMNGDILTDLDFAGLVARHAEAGAAATICVKRRRVDMEFGVIETDEAGDLRAYLEKPSSEVLVSIGVNVVQGSALDRLEPGMRTDVPAFMERTRDAGDRVRCDEVDAFWLDLGRIDDYQAAADLVAANPDQFTPWKM